MSWCKTKPFRNGLPVLLCKLTGERKIHLVHSKFVFTDLLPLNYFLMVCIEKKFLYAHLGIWKHPNDTYDLVGLKYYVCRCITFQVISNPIYFLRHYGVIFCMKLQYKSWAVSEHKLKCSWLCHFSWSLLWLINATRAIMFFNMRLRSSFNPNVSLIFL